MVNLWYWSNRLYQSCRSTGANRKANLFRNCHCFLITKTWKQLVMSTTINNIITQLVVCFTLCVFKLCNVHIIHMHTFRVSWDMSFPDIQRKMNYHQRRNISFENCRFKSGFTDVHAVHTYKIISVHSAPKYRINLYLVETHTLLGRCHQGPTLIKTAVPGVEFQLQ